jgi:hypothetical protein
MVNVLLVKLGRLEPKFNIFRIQRNDLRSPDTDRVILGRAALGRQAQSGRKRLTPGKLHEGAVLGHVTTCDGVDES